MPVSKRFKVKITLILDYEAQFLDSLRFDLSHKFDIPIEKIQIKSEQLGDFSGILELAREYF